jgi:hypothetical protein
MTSAGSSFPPGARSSFAFLLPALSLGPALGGAGGRRPRWEPGTEPENTPAFEDIAQSFETFEALAAELDDFDAWAAYEPPSDPEEN